MWAPSVGGLLGGWRPGEPASRRRCGRRRPDGGLSSESVVVAWAACCVEGGPADAGAGAGALLFCGALLFWGAAANSAAVKVCEFCSRPFASSISAASLCVGERMCGWRVGAREVRCLLSRPIWAFVSFCAACSIADWAFCRSLSALRSCVSVPALRGGRFCGESLWCWGRRCGSGSALSRPR